MQTQRRCAPLHGEVFDAEPMGQLQQHQAQMQLMVLMQQQQFNAIQEQTNQFLDINARASFAMVQAGLKEIEGTDKCVRCRETYTVTIED